ncbi:MULTISPECIES: ABC transporter substrate-binding protein [Aeromicrobium]|uniref:ABC transporter substrate-binding protein n=1 Tax=Aeromicrobium TaxID=2040 RepID=UPI001F40990B|nr:MULTISPECIES: ABC transporter substrate-binding protein [Aeromicrobium]MCL8250290.1 ABC transporter substrate-binding protein [Aeromicrobium fastidiosum]
MAAASALVLAACGGGSDSDGGSDDSSAAAPAAKGDGTLTIGSLLPQTGSLAFLGPPEFAGVDLAINDINAAGGVLGKDVVGVKADSGDTDSGIAPAETDKLLKAKSDVIVGAASSGVSLTVIDKIMSAGVIEYSPANTSTSFDEGDYSKPDLYFRTAPSDILQGAVLANLLIEDGRQNVAILARQDAYGETLAKEISKNLEAAGSTVAANVLYSEKTGPGDSQITEIADAKADAVVLVAFEETTTIIPKLIQAGAGPQDVPTYFVDGNTANYGEGDAASLPDGTLEGTKGTIPGAEATSDFKDRLATVNPDLKDYSYSAESYDAVITSALAAIVADSDSGEAIAKELPGVTEGGEKCTTFEECAALLKDDPKTDIDYDGVSGPIELGETGSPTAASIGIYEYDAKNKISPVKYIAGNI